MDFTEKGKFVPWRELWERRGGRDKSRAAKLQPNIQAALEAERAWENLYSQKYAKAFKDEEQGENFLLDFSKFREEFCPRCEVGCGCDGESWICCPILSEGFRIELDSWAYDFMSLDEVCGDKAVEQDPVKEAYSMSLIPFFEVEKGNVQKKEVNLSQLEKESRQILEAISINYGWFFPGDVSLPPRKVKDENSCCDMFFFEKLRLLITQGWGNERASVFFYPDPEEFSAVRASY